MQPFEGHQHSESFVSDGRPNIVLKQLTDAIAPGLTAIIQATIDSVALFSDWKSAKVSPTFKKDDRHLSENYPPVSLTAVSCKHLEHIVCKHLKDHLEPNKILTWLNHGFKKDFSCENQLLLASNDLCQHWTKDTKAFDTLPHMKLLHKIHRYGIQGQLHSWLTYFLCNRQM